MNGDASFAAAALRLEQLTVFLEANVARHEYEVCVCVCDSFRRCGWFQFFFDKKYGTGVFRYSASPWTGPTAYTPRHLETSF